MPDLASGRGGIVWLRLSALILLLDQATKIYAEYSLELYQSIEILPFLNITLLQNRGAAFSFLADAGGWQRWFFVSLTVVITVFLLRWLRSLNDDEQSLAVALSLIIGGAVGNLIDRIQYGYVVDFIDLYAMGWHWPAFNVADSAITVGAVVVAWDALFGSNPDKGVGNGVSL
ncbi:MAG: lipoprotein signal peptidase [Thiotrichales bacterium]|jgi:signal peptidase II|nr:lipoprotein signal peptidase [Thiotrichales bacterium]MBT3614263.1 lipoprotein signal peptidase [Thiotrichales bacterium]MBT3752278.1 lipoprotein signal peptidase [Thiotrichales bacterium]MBT3837186.1 lipoprotein signal peptidase [Thiotrichales bacterium]MBT4152826.1 lipoprotein signal peptidase [Thiotrichales bacterium]